MVWRTVTVSAACLRRADAFAVIPLSQYRATYLTETSDHARICIAYLYGLINGFKLDFFIDYQCVTCRYSYLFITTIAFQWRNFKYWFPRERTKIS